MPDPDARMDRAAQGRVPIGRLVYTQDGRELGRVKEVHTSHFKLDVSLAEDYWLRLNDVRLVTPDRVIMSFDWNDLRRHRVEDPDADIQQPA